MGHLALLAALLATLLVQPGVIASATCPQVASHAAVLGGSAAGAALCAQEWASGLSSPRGILWVAPGQMLAVTAGDGSIRLLRDLDGDGLVSSSNENVQIAQAPGLNHALVYAGGFLYASSTTTVYRWPYTPATAYTAMPVLGTMQTVVSGLPSGGHATRSLAIYDSAALFFGATARPARQSGSPTTVIDAALQAGSDNWLYVQCGSGGNVDADASRALIRRFDLSAFNPSNPWQWTSGQTAFVGLRNEVALAFDAYGLLWGVENGSKFSCSLCFALPRVLLSCAPARWLTFGACIVSCFVVLAERSGRLKPTAIRRRHPREQSGRGSELVHSR
jgi:glucose/arabinose dehydrogenase